MNHDVIEEYGHRDLHFYDLTWEQIDWLLAAADDYTETRKRVDGHPQELREFGPTCG